MSKGRYKMIKKLIDYGKEIKANYRLTGISTSFFGVSWENVNGTDKQDILRELYVIRRKLSQFYFSYQESLARLEEDDLISTFLFKVIQFNNELADIVLSSKYFVQLPIEKRSEMLYAFDYVMLQEVSIENDEDYEISDDDIQSMIEDLLNLFLEIDKEIHTLNNNM